LINPIQAMHPNKAAPTDSMLIDGQRHVEFNREAYSAWLSALRSVCDARGIVMILDEVFLGFRLAKGGAQEYFGVRADLVTYGKTLGGGFPVGVLCGKSSLMRRFKEGRPADICFARGTFNAHPYVLTAMQAFLDRIKSPEIETLYAEMEVLWTARRERLNRQLADRQLPLRFEGMPTVWSLIFTRPGRYHWLLQFYLRREGIVMSWVGTGRLIFNLQFSEREFEEFSHKLFAAALQFQQHGWWAGSPHRGEAGRIRRQILKELLINRFKSASHGSSDRYIHPLTGKSVSGDRA
jgi:glutamate-1-semialdehyde 2,1-aminomutase